MCILAMQKHVPHGFVIDESQLRSNDRLIRILNVSYGVKPN